MHELAAGFVSGHRLASTDDQTRTVARVVWPSQRLACATVAVVVTSFSFNMTTIDDDDDDDDGVSD